MEMDRKQTALDNIDIFIKRYGIEEDDNDSDVTVPVSDLWALVQQARLTQIANDSLLRRVDLNEWIISKIVELDMMKAKVKT